MGGHSVGRPLSVPSSLSARTGLTDTVVAPTPDRLARPYGRPAAMVLQSGRNGGFIGAQDSSRPESCDLTCYIGIGIPLEWRLLRTFWSGALPSRSLEYDFQW